MAIQKPKNLRLWLQIQNPLKTVFQLLNIVSKNIYITDIKNENKKSYLYLMNYSSKKEIFTFAGIWSDWLDNTTGELIKSVSIITQSANSMMAKIHNIQKRQPVILLKENRDKWFNSGLNYEKILDESFNIRLINKIVESPLKNK